MESKAESFKRTYLESKNLSFRLSALSKTTQMPPFAIRIKSKISHIDFPMPVVPVTIMALSAE